MTFPTPAPRAASSSRGEKCARVALACLFVYSVGVQHNDPDPGRWVAIYGLAGGLQLAALLRPVPIRLAAPLALVAFAWGLTLAPEVAAQANAASGVWEGSRMLDVLLETEEGREMLGLFLVAAATLSLARRRPGRRPEGAPAAEEVSS